MDQNETLSFIIEVQNQGSAVVRQFYSDVAVGSDQAKSHIRGVGTTSTETASAVQRSAGQIGGAYKKVASDAHTSMTGIGRDHESLLKSLGHILVSVGLIGGAFKAWETAKSATANTTELAKETTHLGTAFGLSAKQSSAALAVLKAHGDSPTKLGLAYGSLSRQILAADQAVTGHVKSIDQLRQRQAEQIRVAQIGVANAVDQAGAEQKLQQLRDRQAQQMDVAVQKANRQVEAFHRLGITNDDIKRGVTDFPFLLDKVTKSLDSQRASSEKNATGLVLFGRGYQSLAPLFSTGAEGWTHQIALANQYGATLNGHSIKSTKDLVEAQQTLKYAQMGLEIQFTEKIAPALLKVEAAGAKVVRIFEGPGSMDEKFHKLDQIAGPLVSHLESGLAEALPKIGDVVASAAPKVAHEFITGFEHADFWGQLAIGGIIAHRVGADKAAIGAAGKTALKLFTGGFSGGSPGSSSTGGSGSLTSLAGLTPEDPLFVYAVNAGIGSTGPGLLTTGERTTKGGVVLPEGVTLAETEAETAGIAAASGGGASLLSKLKGGAGGALGIGLLGLTASQIGGHAIGGSTGKQVATIGSGVSIGAGLGSFGGLPGIIAGGVAGGLSAGIEEWIAHSARSEGEKIGDKLKDGLKHSLAGPLPGVSDAVTKTVDDANKHLQQQPVQQAHGRGGYYPQGGHPAGTIPSTPDQIAAANRSRYRGGLKVGGAFTQDFANDPQHLDLNYVIQSAEKTLASPRLGDAGRAGADKVITEFVAEMQKKGRLPDGSLNEFVETIHARFGDLSKYSGEAGAATVESFETAFKTDKALKANQDFIAALNKDWQGLPKQANLSFGNAGQIIGENLDALKAKAANSSGQTKDDALAAYKELHDKAVAYFKDLKTQTATESFQTAETLGGNTKAGTVAVSAGYAQMANVIAQQMTAGVTSTKTGTRQIQDELAKALESLGVSKGDIKKLESHGGITAADVTAAQQVSSSPTNPGQLGLYAGGGFLGGNGLNDTVPIMAAPGEAVVNRHQQPEINRAMAFTKAQGAGRYGSLGELFSNVTTPHYMAKGGVAKPNFDGHPANVQPQIAQLIGFMENKFPQLQVTDTTDHSTLTTNGNVSYHVSGRAVDMASTPEYMDAVSAWINSSGFYKKLTEGIHNPNLSVKGGAHVPASFWGAATWAEHANHIHMAIAGELGSSISKGVSDASILRSGSLTGSTPSLKQVNSTGFGIAGAMSQSALGVVHAAAQHIVNKASPYGPAHAGPSTSIGAVGKLSAGQLAKYNHTYPAHGEGQGGVQFSPQVVAEIANWAGLPGTTFAQIAHGESDYFPGVVEATEGPGEGGKPVQGWGLWQITTGVGNDPMINALGGPYAMLNPLINARASRKLYDAAGGISPWHGTRFVQNAARGGMVDYAGQFGDGGSVTASRPTMLMIGDKGPETAFMMPHRMASGGTVPSGYQGTHTILAPNGGTLTWHDPPGQYMSPSDYAVWKDEHPHVDKPKKPAAPKHHTYTVGVSIGGTELGTYDQSAIHRPAPVNIDKGIQDLTAATWGHVQSILLASLDQHSDAFDLKTLRIVGSRKGRRARDTANTIRTDLSSKFENDFSLDQQAAQQRVQHAQLVAQVQGHGPQTVAYAQATLAATRRAAVSYTGDRTHTAALLKSAEAAHQTALVKKLKNDLATIDDQVLQSKVDISDAKKAVTAANKTVAQAFLTHNQTAMTNFIGTLNDQISNAGTSITDKDIAYIEQQVKTGSKLSTGLHLGSDIQAAFKAVTQALHDSVLSNIQSYETVFGNAQTFASTQASIAQQTLHNAGLDDDALQKLKDQQGGVLTGAQSSQAQTDLQSFIAGVHQQETYYQQEIDQLVSVQKDPSKYNLLSFTEQQDMTNEIASLRLTLSQLDGTIKDQTDATTDLTSATQDSTAAQQQFTGALSFSYQGQDYVVGQSSDQTLNLGVGG